MWIQLSLLIRQKSLSTWVIRFLVLKQWNNGLNCTRKKVMFRYLSLMTDDSQSWLVMSTAVSVLRFFSLFNWKQNSLWIFWYKGICHGYLSFLQKTVYPFASKIHVCFAYISDHLTLTPIRSDKYMPSIWVPKLYRGRVKSRRFPYGTYWFWSQIRQKIDW